MPRRAVTLYSRQKHEDGMMKGHVATLRYFLRHKWCVFKECRKLGVPLWIAILHDWDKFLPDVWFPYMRMNTPPPGVPEERLRRAFRQAKMTHQNRNKHHWQFWVFIGDCGEMEALAMPDVWRREMLADWRGAAISMGKPDLLGWYGECRGAMVLHAETRAWLDEQLGYGGEKKY